MKLIIDSPILGKRTYSSDDFLPVIKDQLKLLNHYKNDGRKPSKQLLQDIKVYEFIIKHPEAEKMADLYLRKMDAERERLKTFGIPKMKIAKMLGWF